MFTFLVVGPQVFFCFGNAAPLAPGARCGCGNSAAQADCPHGGFLKNKPPSPTQTSCGGSVCALKENELLNLVNAEIENIQEEFDCDTLYSEEF